MSTLKERLDRIRDGFRRQAPPETLVTMENARVKLADSGLMDRIPKVGDELPTFTLPDTEGASTDAAALLAIGPAVIVFYRGAW